MIPSPHSKIFHGTILLVALFLVSLSPQISSAAHAISPALREPSGNLSGRVIYTSGGHGWVFFDTYWSLQRAPGNDMVEDYGNLDQMNFFGFYCFNAGATVVPLRPIGFQTNEVVLHNDGLSVSYSGSWTKITNEAVYFGAVGSGFHQANSSTNETALATFTPNIPVTGFYPVYTWVPHGANRTNQLYRVRHTGGESTVRIPHHMVGHGWVYLGTYYLNSGSNSVSGSVAISDFQPNANTNTVVIADAIRFGNGMSTSGSTYPREDEGGRWWIQNSLGQGQSSSIYLEPAQVSDYEDRMARPKMAAEMNRPQTGRTNRLYISFHSNAFNTSARGTVGLYNSTNATPRQSQLAGLMAQELNNDLPPLNSQLEYAWTVRAATNLAGPYVEIDHSRLNGEMDATILEVAFHDNAMDAALMRDPKFRNWVGRASYQAVVRYMAAYDGGPLTFLPEPPSNLRAIAVTNGVKLSWSVPVASGGSGAPTGFVVYRSSDGYGFGNPVVVSGATATNLTLTNLTAETDHYFRVAAFNIAGESFPSETAGCSWTANVNATKVLFVNAFTRFDRTTNLRMPTSAQSYQPPGKIGTAERVIPRANNSFDYVVQHGEAISAYGLPFDSCHKDAVASGLIALTNYYVVVWECGQDVTNNFNSAMQSKVTAFLTNHGNLFLSGAGIAYSLDRAAGPSAADRAFFNNVLRADLASDAHTNSGSYTFIPNASNLFNGNDNGTIDDGTKGIYWVKSPEVLTPVGSATTAISYSGVGGGAAAIEYCGPDSGRIIYFGFPFETITSAALRETYMAAALNFLSSAPPRFNSIHLSVDGTNVQFTLLGKPGGSYMIEASTNLTQWSLLTNVVFTNTQFQFDEPVGDTARFYRAVLDE